VVMQQNRTPATSGRPNRSFECYLRERTQRGPCSPNYCLRGVIPVAPYLRVFDARLSDGGAKCSQTSWVCALWPQHSFYGLVERSTATQSVRFGQLLPQNKSSGNEASPRISLHHCCVARPITRQTCMPRVPRPTQSILRMLERSNASFIAPTGHCLANNGQSPDEAT
jgi:hypothetical protein